MFDSRYTLVHQDESKHEYSYTRPTIQSKLRIALLSIFLSVSLGFNGYFAYFRTFLPWEVYEQLPSQYAHLRRTFPVEILSHSNFSSTNRTIQDAAWNHPDLNEWDTVTALDDQYIIAQGLPYSQRWPWGVTKGVYILSGGHNIHCINVMREFINDEQDGIRQEDRFWKYPHVIHCLDTLREVVMCDADDTPLYTGRIYRNTIAGEPKAGIGMIKKCRDWSAMMRWARDHSACYQQKWRGGPYNETSNYMYCPDGQRPWDSMNEKLTS